MTPGLMNSNMLCMISEEDEDQRSPSIETSPNSPTGVKDLMMPTQLSVAKARPGTVFKARAEITTLV